MAYAEQTAIPPVAVDALAWGGAAATAGRLRESSPQFALLDVTKRHLVVADVDLINGRATLAVRGAGRVLRFRCGEVEEFGHGTVEVQASDRFLLATADLIDSLSFERLTVESRAHGAGRLSPGQNASLEQRATDLIDHAIRRHGERDFGALLIDVCSGGQ